MQCANVTPSRTTSMIYPDVTPCELRLRLADTTTYPCGDEGINGMFRSGCRAPCCIVPGMTPDGEDSPKWVATLEELENEASNMRQPDFGTPKRPFSPSQCSLAEQEFFGRRQLRKMNGQDPEKNPELFTPQARPRNLMKFVWPEWPKDANKCTCKRCQ